MVERVLHRRLRGDKGGFVPPKPFLAPLKIFNDKIQKTDNEVNKAQYTVYNIMIELFV